MAFCIVGSCVTRDIWEFGDRPYNGKYFARTSLANLTSPTVKLKNADLEKLDSPFQRACIIADAYRQQVSWILEHQPDEIILDFIDERFDVIDTGSGSLSNSFELKSSGVVSAKYPDATIIAKGSEQGLQRWKDGLQQFIETVRTQSPKSKLILHRAWFQTHIAEPSGSVPWERGVNIPSRTEPIAAFNEMLATMYMLAEQLDIDETFEAEPNHQFSAAEHKWGRSHVHYVEDYYLDCWRKLSPLIS